MQYRFVHYFNRICYNDTLFIVNDSLSTRTPGGHYSISQVLLKQLVDHGIIITTLL